MRTLRLTLTTFASISLLAAGCGSSDSDSTDNPATGAGVGGSAGSGGSSTGTGGSAGHKATGGSGGSTGGQSTGGSAGSSAGPGGHPGAGGGGTTGAGGKATGGSAGTTGGSGGTTGGSGGTTGGSGGTMVGAGGTTGGSGGSTGGSAGMTCATTPPGLPAVRIADGSSFNEGTPAMGDKLYFRSLSDGRAIVYTLGATSATFEAINLDGTGTPEMIMPGADSAEMVRDVLFFWTNTDTTTATAKLWVWSPTTNGPKVLVDSGFPTPVAATSATAPANTYFYVNVDSTVIVYPTNAAASKGKTADFVRANVDGTNPVTVATTSFATPAKCATTFGDSGDTVVVGACDASNVLSYYSIKNGASEPALVAVGAGDATYDPAGKTLFTISSTGDAFLYDLTGVPVPGGSGGAGGSTGGSGGAGGGSGPVGTMVDTGVGAATSGATAYAHYSADGAEIFYPTKDKRLRKSPVAAPAPVDLATGLGFVWPRFNESFTFVSKAFNGAQNTGDLFLAASTDGTLTPVSADAKSTLFTGDFTPDGSYIMFYDKVNTSLFIGQLETAPIAGTPVTTRGDINGWDVLSTGGTNVVYNDNYFLALGTPMGVYGTADIKLVDIAAAGPETIVVSGGYSVFDLSKDKKFVVYDYADPCGDAAVTGTYVAKLPLLVPSKEKAVGANAQAAFSLLSRLLRGSYLNWRHS